LNWTDGRIKREYAPIGRMLPPTGKLVNEKRINDKRITKIDDGAA
jgi:hypothetical protein